MRSLQRLIVKADFGGHLFPPTLKKFIKLPAVAAVTVAKDIVGACAVLRHDFLANAVGVQGVPAVLDTRKA